MIPIVARVNNTEERAAGLPGCSGATGSASVFATYDAQGNVIREPSKEPSKGDGSIC
jgi:hypothetical protein